jgi:hypothetical protein
MLLAAVWVGVFGMARGLRRAIRRHYAQWFRSHVPTIATPTSRRLLIDPRYPAIPSRRLLA